MTDTMTVHDYAAEHPCSTRAGAISVVRDYYAAAFGKLAEGCK